MSKVPSLRGNITVASRSERDTSTSPVYTVWPFGCPSPHSLSGNPTTYIDTPQSFSQPTSTSYPLRSQRLSKESLRWRNNQSQKVRSPKCHHRADRLFLLSSSMRVPTLSGSKPSFHNCQPPVVSAPAPWHQECPRAGCGALPLASGLLALVIDQVSDTRRQLLHPALLSRAQRREKIHY